MRIGRNNRHFWLFLIVNACLLCTAAFYNQYPLVFSDTGTYIIYGEQLRVPGDRPALYGLFLRWTSLGMSTWLTVFCQSLLTAFLIMDLAGCFIRRYNYLKASLLITFILSVFSAVSWFTSQLMPDIFTALLLMSFILLLLKPKLSASDILVYTGITVLAIGSHLSNLFIALAFVAGFVVFRYKYILALYLKRLACLCGMLLLAYVSVFVTNYILEKKAFYSKGGNVFLVGRLLDTGILEDYLRCNCPQKPLQLCKYKDTLPDNSRKLHFDVNSPVNREGGWQAVEAEYGFIAKDALTKPRYLLLFLKESVTGCLSMVFQNETGWGMVSDWYKDPGSPPYRAIHDYHYSELHSYLNSRQNKTLFGQGLEMNFFNVANWLLTMLSYFLLLVLLVSRSVPRDGRYFLIVMTAIGVLMNDLVTSSLAYTIDRYHTRVSWLLPAAFIIAYFDLFADRVKGVFNKVQRPD